MVVALVRQASLLDDDDQMFWVLISVDNQDGCRTCTSSISVYVLPRQAGLLDDDEQMLRVIQLNLNTESVSARNFTRTFSGFSRRSGTLLWNGLNKTFNR